MATHSPPEYRPTAPPPPSPSSTTPADVQDPLSMLSYLLSSVGLAVDISKLTPLLLLVPFLYNWATSLYEQISTILSSFLWCRMECVRWDDEPFDQLISWLASQPFTNSSRNLVVTAVQGKEMYDDNGNFIPRDAEEIEQAGFDFTPAEGLHRFWYKGHLIFYHRYRKQGETYQETIELSTIARSPRILKEIFAEARTAWLLRDSHKTIIYRESSNSDDWRRSIARFPRPLSTVVLSTDLKRTFLADVRDYLAPATERWYTARGIPYRRGYLFYGPPGTGKSSLSFAVAGVFGLKVYVLSLASPKLTEERLAGLFGALPKKCVLLLEDVDAAFISRTSGEKVEDNATARGKDKAEGENKEKKEKKETMEKEEEKQKENSSNSTSKTIKEPTISFSALLNAIDGVASQEGRILIMTTNHIEKLDPALIRPGRVDMRIEFKLADASVLAVLFKRMFRVYPDEDPDGEEKDGSKLAAAVKCTDEEALKLLGEIKDKKGKKWSSRNAIKERGEKSSHALENRTDGGDDEERELDLMAEEFARMVPSDRFSPADIQGFLLRYKWKPEEALAATEDWVKEQENERRKKMAPKVDAEVKREEGDVDV